MLWYVSVRVCRHVLVVFAQGKALDIPDNPPHRAYLLT
jgi:hypothetical protein